MVRFSCYSLILILLAMTHFRGLDSKAVNNENGDDLDLAKNPIDEAIPQLPMTKLRRQTRDAELLCAEAPQAARTYVVSTPRDWIEAANKATNEHRKNHGADPLEINDELCKISQYWGDTLANASKFDHSKYGCGENLWMGSHLGEAKGPIDAWYSEVENYDFTKHDAKSGKGFNDIGHFTQLVWKGTKSQCVTYSKKSDGGGVVVGTYYPPGNYKGEYAKNVEGGAGTLIGSQFTKCMWLLLIFGAFGMKHIACAF